MKSKNRKRMIELVEMALGIEIVTTESGRAAYYAKETGEWYWLIAEDLRYAFVCRKHHGSDAYSHWCNGAGKLVRSRASIAALES